LFFSPPNRFSQQDFIAVAFFEKNSGKSEKSGKTIAKYEKKTRVSLKNSHFLQKKVGTIIIFCKKKLVRFSFFAKNNRENFPDLP
jgi:hypothetical protein